MKDTLAIKGGSKAFDLELPPHPVVGSEERAAVDRVFERNQFSEFIAAAGKHFFGGIEVQAFENEVATSADCEYGVAFNSWTSGLHAAVAACEVDHLDYVYTSPYTFTSSATCALMNNAIPVFVDVDKHTGNISAETLQAAIEKYPGGKALVLVHLFGLPADMDEILAICKKHGIKVIEDAAQAPGASYKGKAVCSLGDCGGFSFTQSKTVMCGEGGVLVTNNERIAEIARMVRNHGEVLAEERTYNSMFLGMGYRMTELEAAIGREQWKKLDRFNNDRISLNEAFQKRIESICDFIHFPKPSYTHVNTYYATSMLFDAEKAGVSRNAFTEALAAEGVPVGAGYVKPLYYQDIYQKRNHASLKADVCKVDYSPGICPNAESLHFEKLFLLGVLRPPMSTDMLNQLCDAFEKVINGRTQL